MLDFAENDEIVKDEDGQIYGVLLNGFYFIEGN